MESHRSLPGNELYWISRHNKLIYKIYLHVIYYPIGLTQFVGFLELSVNVNVTVQCRPLTKLRLRFSISICAVDAVA